MKFRRKPVVIDAVQFDPEVKPWPECIIPWDAGGYAPRDMSWGYINTPEARRNVQSGDWIITYLSGAEYDLMKPEIFALTYEPVE